MARDGDMLFSIIIPSTGRRPKALQKAVDSVDAAARFAGLEKGQVEILIGFDGPKGNFPISPVRMKVAVKPARLAMTAEASICPRTMTGATAFETYCST